MNGEQLAISLLGTFSVAVNDHVVPENEWHLKRAADLVKLLALAPRHRLPREEVIEALWPDGQLDRSAVNLRKVAFQARHALGLADGVVLEDGLVKLAPHHTVLTDRDSFVDAASQAIGSGDAAACRAAAAQYGGELLPDDPYVAWCEQEGRYLRGLFRELLEQGQLWGRLVREEPTNERAHREIMQAQLERGDRAGAIRQFDLLRTTLREELGVAPGPDTVALYNRALDMDGRDAPTPAERARALLAWGLVHWQRSDLDEAQRTAAEARALSIDAGLPRELTEASELLALIAHVQGNWHEVFAENFMESLSRNAGLAPFVFDANICLSEFALGEQNGLSDVAAMARRLIQFSTRTGSPQAEALGRLLRGETALLSGLVGTEVREDLTHAVRLHRESSSTTGWALAAERGAQLESRGGNRARAREAHRQALHIAEQTAVREHLMPLIYGGMLQGETAGTSRDVIDEAEDAFSRHQACDTCAMSFRVNASMVSARSGDLGRSEHYLDEARRVAPMWSGGPWHAAVDEADATLLLALGGAPADVVALFERAGARFRSANHQRDADRCEQSAASVPNRSRLLER
ncbi:transcriptional activator domain-containing protein [Diaminobutyricibacter tongyongensis]|uniref:Transcriptional activator domain-containing protein n=1 Tax=Leifsonia tongyongensis TaxID=1268043 RepID=A0A6L9Y212_9MICO|nr:BTAD domain-containing putative transcriptional regulator [Diaminobutyricibacter tongyongensis]NEN07721.1 transcriptional activator domain-containing protein [Diaminobutyricibacter tongyongensis]